ncbi:hypothetical protein [Demequina sp. NBRC 110054]|uniref:hypothetical protein n=1 Tax=Demequina sp. NBRC 110054 TaxID=1570343 RepID=UPI000A014E2F|nr:hypothetical protein [Demequina sp. NBRC 110054]
MTSDDLTELVHLIDLTADGWTSLDNVTAVATVYTDPLRMAVGSMLDRLDGLTFGSAWAEWAAANPAQAVAMLDALVRLASTLGESSLLARAS